MSAIYDNLEIVLRREQFRQLCLADSRSPSFQSASSSNSHLGNEFEEHGEQIYRLVLKVDVRSDKQKLKAMEKLCLFQRGHDCFFGYEGEMFTVEGSMDPIEVVAKLRKSWNGELISVESVANSGQAKRSNHLHSDKPHP